MVYWNHSSAEWGSARPTASFRPNYVASGILILTTPAGWTNRLLYTLAAVGLLSEEEIREHVFAYTLPLLGWYFGVAGSR